MQDLPFTLPKYVDNLPPTTFESNARTLKVNQIKDFENVVKESVYFSQKIIKYHSIKSSYYMTRIKLEADPQSEEFCLKFSRKSRREKLLFRLIFIREELFRLKIWFYLYFELNWSSCAYNVKIQRSVCHLVYNILYGAKGKMFIRILIEFVLKLLSDRNIRTFEQFHFEFLLWFHYSISININWYIVQLTKLLATFTSMSSNSESQP